MKLSVRQLCLLALTSLLSLHLAECVPLTVSGKTSRGDISTSAIDVSRVLRFLQSKSAPKMEARSITAFVTDPALLVTILHSLEVAYWTLPFGFILTPIINLFRMPNRRRIETRTEMASPQTQNFYQTLEDAIKKIEKLNKEKKSSI